MTSSYWSKRSKLKEKEAHCLSKYRGQSLAPAEEIQRIAIQSYYIKHKPNVLKYFVKIKWIENLYKKEARSRGVDQLKNLEADKSSENEQT